MTKQTALLTIDNLHVSVENKKILNGVNLIAHSNKIYAIMGPNGSGKSTLAYTLMGHPKYKITNGSMFLSGKELKNMPVDQRAKHGIFLGFQYPYEVEGVPLRDFLRQSYNAIYGGTDKQLGIKAFRKLIDEKMELLSIRSDFVDRALNVGFSGGEKKRAEILQLAVLQPKLAILDEIDSGLDIDALRIVCESITKLKENNPEMMLLIITHYQRILKYLSPNVIHVMQDGIISRSGSKELADELEREGYDN